MERSGNIDTIKPIIGIDTANLRAELVRNLQVGKYINLPSNEKVEIKDINEWFEKDCNSLIEKYGFNENESKIFKSNVTINPCDMQLKERGLSTGGIQKFDDGQRKPICRISMNPNIIRDKMFYEAVLYHELDHHAFEVKKFLASDLYKCNFSTQYNEENARLKWNAEANSLAKRFSTELIARIDTADELMKRGVPRENVREYGPGNENETSGEKFYTESILCAKNFLSFQIGLYNLLSKHYELNPEKPKNQQLPDEANKYFKVIMNRLRDNIFNSPSIETTKNMINRCYTKLQEARGSWKRFQLIRNN